MQSDSYGMHETARGRDSVRDDLHIFVHRVSCVEIIRLRTVLLYVTAVLYHVVCFGRDCDIVSSLLFKYKQSVPTHIRYVLYYLLLANRRRLMNDDGKRSRPRATATTESNNQASAEWEQHHERNHIYAAAAAASAAGAAGASENPHDMPENDGRNKNNNDRLCVDDVVERDIDGVWFPAKVGATITLPASRKALTVKKVGRQTH